MQKDSKSKQKSDSLPKLMKAKKVSESRDTKTALPHQEIILKVRKHRLVIPAGAVTEPTEIVMTEPESEHIEVTIEATKRPDLLLNRRAVLTLSYKDRKKEGESVDDLQIFQIIPGTDKVVGTPPSKPQPHDRGKNEVEAELEHFSGYAIGNGRADAPTG